MKKDLDNQSAEQQSNFSLKDPQQTDGNNFFDDDFPLFNGTLENPRTSSDSQNDVYEWNFSDYEKFNSANEYGAHKQSKGLIVLSSFLAFSLIAVVMMFGIYVYYQNQHPVTAASQQNNTLNGPSLLINDSPSTSEMGQQVDDGESTATIAAEVTPSVVGIVTYNEDLSNDPIGQGSGVIMSEDGYIVTNSHVLLDTDNDLASTIQVVLNNNSEYEAEVIGIDLKTDLAVVKIDAQNLTYAQFGNSDQVKVGDRVIAIGNPGGVSFMGSVSQGIVSGLNRTVKTTSGFDMTLIQTDAAINPGNSGGALVNRYGQVIGINSAKIRKTNYEGIGFSIPTNNAKPIIDDLIEYGYVKNRVKIGISYKEIDTILAKVNDIPEGLYILSVDSDLDAGNKGLLPGDIITKVNGKDVQGSDTLAEELDGKEAGDSITLTIYRSNYSNKISTFQIKIKLSEDKGGIPDSSSILTDEDDDIFTSENAIDA